MKNSSPKQKQKYRYFFCYQHFFTFFIHNITSKKIKNNKTKQQTHTQYLTLSMYLLTKIQSKGGREGRTRKTQKSLLYTVTYIKEKALPSINGRRLGPLIRAVVHSHVTICRRLRIHYVFLHMCGVNQFCIIVFFAAVKPANNILFCIELIQRPESSLRRHKLGLKTNQFAVRMIKPGLHVSID